MRAWRPLCVPFVLLIAGPFGAGAAPPEQPAEKEQAYVGEFVGPDETLDLVQGETRLLVLEAQPTLVQMTDSQKVATYSLVSPKQISVGDKSPGTCTFFLWFAPPDKCTRKDVVALRVRVLPPSLRVQLATPTGETFRRHVRRVVDPIRTLHLEAGHARVLFLKQKPARVQISDESVAATEFAGATRLVVEGVAQGRAVLNLWFTDPDDKTKETILCYLLEVAP
jgi:hypothetical protein